MFDLNDMALNYSQWCKCITAVAQIPFLMNLLGGNKLLQPLSQTQPTPTGSNEQ